MDRLHSSQIHFSGFDLCLVRFLRPQEGQQVDIELLLVRQGEAVGRTRMDLKARFSLLSLSEWERRLQAFLCLF